MTTIATDLRNTVESARRIRFEPALPITATNVQDAITQAQAASLPPVPTPVNVAMSPYNTLPTDRILLVDTSGGPVAINLGTAAARNGLDIIVRDITGNAVANNISVAYAGTADGLASPIAIAAPFGGWRFVPLANGNWYLGDL